MEYIRGEMRLWRKIRGKELPVVGEKEGRKKERERERDEGGVRHVEVE